MVCPKLSTYIRRWWQGGWCPRQVPEESTQVKGSYKVCSHRPLSGLHLLGKGECSESNTCLWPLSRSQTYEWQIGQTALSGVYPGADLTTMKSKQWNGKRMGIEMRNSSNSRSCHYMIKTTHLSDEPFILKYIDFEDSRATTNWILYILQFITGLWGVLSWGGFIWSKANIISYLEKIIYRKRSEWLFKDNRLHRGNNNTTKKQISENLRNYPYIQATSISLGMFGFACYTNLPKGKFWGNIGTQWLYRAVEVADRGVYFPKDARNDHCFHPHRTGGREQCS